MALSTRHQQLGNLNLQELVALRHDLHAHPEIAGEEEHTASRIVEYLKKYEPDKIITGLGGHGVAAVFNGASSGKRVLVRAELDALPIAEFNELSYRSINAGKGHKCGHDGHMTMVAGLAQIYGKTRPARGDVVLMFQPAEEPGQGAQAVCADPQFADIRPDYAFALHNIPGEEMGAVLCKPGPFSSSVESIVVKIKGRTSHAAEPEEALSAGAAMAPILTWIYDRKNLDKTDENFMRLAVTGISSGEQDAYGITAGDGEFSVSLRARTPENLEVLRREFKAKVECEIANYNQKHQSSNGLTLTFIEGIEPFRTNTNDLDAVETVRRAATLNNFNYKELEVPYPWGEDFGIFTNLEGVKGVMFGLGAGEDTPVLHDPRYDFPDQLIPKGIGMFYHMIESLDHNAL